MKDELIEKAKARIYENRLKLARAAAVTATMVACYYIGKSKGAVVVKFYPSKPIAEEPPPLRSYNFKR